MTASVGIVANPASGRDIRRLVAQASVFPTAEKANMVQRLLSALATSGVERALLSTDLSGISAAVLRASRNRQGWPELRFCDEDPLTGTAQDTTNAVRRMVAAGARVIVCLGGDGTARVTAAACGEVPMLALSTGTNNTFPQVREATVAGLAVGLVAVGAVTNATRRMSVLEVVTQDRKEIALVDVCASSSHHVGAKALWHPETLSELCCTFAEPDGIGLSSVPGLLCPVSRDSPDGVALQLTSLDRARVIVRAPIAPGLVIPVGVKDWWPLRPGDEVPIAAGAGVIAVDGEREIELTRGQPATVRLRADGPRCVDVTEVLSQAASQGLLCTRREESRR